MVTINWSICYAYMVYVSRFTLFARVSVNVFNIGEMSTNGPFEV